MSVDGYAVPGSEAEFQRLAEVESESFAFPVSDVPSWFAATGRENVRVVRRGKDVAGGLLLVDMGQFWGGRSLKLGGVSGVAIAATARGTGVGTELMVGALRELRERGYPLSGLYPATQPIYRKVGYEQAGARFELRGPLSALPKLRHELPMRAVRTDDLPLIHTLYTEHARRRPGYLDRGRYAWSRVQTLRGTPAPGYVVEENGVLAGYVFLIRNRRPDLWQDLTITDWCARTPAAWKRLLAFAADHGSIAEELSWHGSETDPLLLLLDEQQFSAGVKEWWMLRILDVGRALSERGYPRVGPVELHLEISDPLFAENTGRYVLEVSGGEGKVRPGGSGALACDVRTLAPLFSGHRSATQLWLAGRVRGTPEALATADELFHGPAPTMPDMY